MQKIVLFKLGTMERVKEKVKMLPTKCAAVKIKVFGTVEPKDLIFKKALTQVAFDYVQIRKGFRQFEKNVFLHKVKIKRIRLRFVLMCLVWYFIIKRMRRMEAIFNVSDESEEEDTPQ